MKKEYPSLLWLGCSPLYTFISFSGLGDNFTKKEIIKKRREGTFISISHQMVAYFLSPLNMSPVYFIISQLGFSLPRSRTIYMSLSTPPTSYSSSHMERVSMPRATFHDITWCSLAMLPSHSCVVPLCVQGKYQPMLTLCSSPLTFLSRQSLCQLHFITS